MLDATQIKAVELLVTGHTMTETAEELEVNVSTVRGWTKNADFMKELSEATDLFAKECVKNRSRQYRAMTKKIIDKVMEKIERGNLEDFPIDDLIRMLHKTIELSKNDEDSKKLPSITAVQNNINFMPGIEDKLKQQDFMSRFGDLLVEFDPNDIEQMAADQKRAEERANR